MVCSVFCTHQNYMQLLATHFHYFEVNSLMSITHSLFQMFWGWKWQEFICDIDQFLYGIYSLLLHYITSLCTEVGTVTLSVCYHIPQSQPIIICSDTDHFISHEKWPDYMKCVNFMGLVHFVMSVSNDMTKWTIIQFLLHDSQRFPPGELSPNTQLYLFTYTHCTTQPVHVTAGSTVFGTPSLLLSVGFHTFYSLYSC